MNDKEILMILSKILFLPKEIILKQIGENFFSSLGYPNYMWRNEHVILKMIKQTKRIMKITESYDKDVIELGCGMGFNAIIMAMSGAHRVTALDYSKDHITMLGNMVRVIDHPVLYEKLEIICGDALNTGLQSNKYDVIQTLDVLSHCQDLDKFISEIRRLGKHGSVVYVLDGNNGLKFGEAKEIIRIQHLAEHGPLEEAHKEGRCIGIKSTYLTTRKEIIEKNFPGLDMNVINKLAQKTSGMYGNQIIDTVNNFLSGSELNECSISYPDVCKVKPLYRNPVNGMWPEIAFSPYKLKNYLNNNNKIHVRLIPYKHTVLSGGIKGFIKRQLAILVELLYPASIFLAPGFELVGNIEKN